MRLHLLTLLALILPPSSFSQTINIDGRVIVPEIKSGHLNMGNPGPTGKELLVNSKYLSLGGQPILPVMGEIHPSRVKAENWEESILKMKANGINIISFYIFWIHHEEIEGEFIWRGNNDIRKFVELCKKHNVWAYPRLGPWCHGEVRNGGLPDWLLKKENLRERTNDTTYQFYAERLYGEISQQLSGLYYKDGGPIIGVQIENEYWRGKEGESHILWLKETAQKYGIDVPMYTITAWRSTSLPENEVIPLWGGYPAAPWNTDINKIEHNDIYLFKKPVNDESIGHKEKSEAYSPDYSPYPYFTCELGVGNQISEHRRPEIAPIDGMAISLSNLASGSNLPGYYVFAGGLNPVGKRTTLEEERRESGYWNEYPDISYDFQAAISEAGEIMPSYHELKPLHYFLNEFGSLLAPLPAIVPNDNEEWDDLQYSFRTDGHSGFLFVSNYYRGHSKSRKKNVQFDIQLQEETMHIPQQAVDIPDSSVFIWPVKLSLGEALLRQSTCQLIFNLQEKDTATWFFKKSKGIQAEYSFSTEEIRTISYQGKALNADGKTYRVQNARTGLPLPIFLTMENGNVHKIITLTEEQSKKLWYFREGHQEYAFLSSANLFMDDQQQLHAFSVHPTDTLIPLNRMLSTESMYASEVKSKNVNFQQWIITKPEDNIQVPIEQADLIDSIQWLQLHPEKYDEQHQMYHKQFFKKFTLENTAEIRKAGIYLLSGLTGKLRINDRWVNQEYTPDQVCYLDLTGYIQKGENNILIDFPYVAEPEFLGALIEVEYYNSNKEYIRSDTSWLTTEQYKIPAPWDDVRNKRIPEVHILPEEYAHAKFIPNRYSIKIDLLNSLLAEKHYLRINYKGNKAKCRIGKNLVADNFNNGTTWTIKLSDLTRISHQDLIVELEPWDAAQLIYLDKNQKRVLTEEPEIINCIIEVENKLLFSIR